MKKNTLYVSPFPPTLSLSDFLEVWLTMDSVDVPGIVDDRPKIFTSFQELIKCP